MPTCPPWAGAGAGADRAGGGSLRLGEAEHAAILVESTAETFRDHFLDEVKAVADLQGVGCVTGRARSPAHFPYHALSEAIQDLIPRIEFGAPRYDPYRQALSTFVPDIALSRADARPGPAPAPPAASVAAECAGDPGRGEAAPLGLRDLVPPGGRPGGAPRPLPARARAGAPATIELIEFIVRNVALLRRDPRRKRSSPGNRGGDGGGGRRGTPRLLVVVEYEEPVGPGAPDEAVALDPGPQALLDRLTSLRTAPSTLRIPLPPIPREQIGEWVARRCPGFTIPPQAAPEGLRGERRSAPAPR